MVIADTGFWLALASSKDRHHGRASEVLAALTEPLVTTWPVATETCFLLLTRLGPASQRSFLASFAAGGFQLFDLSREHAPRLAALLDRYSDLAMDLADASLVLLAEHLGHGRILTTDRRDFAAYRWRGKEPFENLLL